MIKNKLSVSVAFASIIFFYFFIFVGKTLVNPEWRLSWVVVPTVIGIVSLIGLLLAVRELRHQSKRWYLGIPQAIVLIILCCTGLIIFFRGVTSSDYLSVPLALLSLGSVGFFLSFPESRKKITYPFALVSGLISMYALFYLYNTIHGILFPMQTSWNIVALLDGLYSMYLLPIIGLCYLATAFRVRE